MPVDPRNLVSIQNRPENIRNICILAHVDHGKTSLSDTLLASNGIISQQMQGQIRYLDSRPDEQLRGITMEASAISLYFKAARKEADQEEPVIKEYLVNLIDAPGHIDFASEVSTASRLCDGTVILVDAVEGVCSQTVVVLKQTWDEELKPVLVINKIDRLISELQLSAAEAATHLTKLVEQVNAVIGSFYAGKRMEEDLKWREAQEQQTDATDFEELSDEDIYFTPQKNNVVFCSAIDGWGFSISQFAAIYERKLGVKREKLEQFLWGNYYLDPKTKKVSKTPGKGAKTMFVQFILDNIWAVYSAVNNQDVAKIEKIVGALSLKVSERELNSGDAKYLLSHMFNQWIPVSRSILLAVINCIPSPLQAQEQRMDLVLEESPDSELIDQTAVEAMHKCDSNGPVVTFVSKVMQVPKKDIPLSITDRLSELRMRSERIRQEAAGIKIETTESNQEVIIGVARVYSGTVEVGQELDLLSPKYTPKDSSREHRSSVKITGLYILMGRDLVPVHKAYPGNIIGITGLDGHIVKTGTLVSPGLQGPNFARGHLIAKPILRVAVEPVDPRKIPELEAGLEMLNISDPSVEISMSDAGEYILATAGELHLERCIKDLQERFARVDLDVSQPIVPYRETIVDAGEWVPEEDSEYQERGLGGFEVGDLKVELQVVPLPDKVFEFLTEGVSEDKLDEHSEKYIVSVLTELFDQTGIPEWSHIVDKLVCFGPWQTGPNLLIDLTGKLQTRAFGQSSRGVYDEGLISGFQAAVAKGPLAGEPVQGVACIVRKVSNDGDAETNSKLLQRRLISFSRQLIWKCMEEWSPRLRLATYLCDIQATTEVLGKVYGVVTRRQGKVISEDLKEGTPFFNVQASLPVIESFGFSEEMRKRTSGNANPQLVFNGFSTLDLDPFWVPTTEEELEALGETADRENVALTHLHAIRRRKGMQTSEKLVENAEQLRSRRG
ncbi:Ribosome assembly protein 1 [Wickerhamiella sorbophila]|uniref:Ribosome assembly protein 1 n=1 Tax=Wickerhamiella sorbophila TaxID=45607 RepID=A0A2T0FC82_9ASCO|nr:Ribosome assembly protein 1 [Wickerhamiella sorbophila]PRT52577.1 Ribosome assembly protein 1 [Wickerhamiella sorbophila]